MIVIIILLIKRRSSIGSRYQDTVIDIVLCQIQTRARGAVVVRKMMTALLLLFHVVQILRVAARSSPRRR